MRVVNKQEFMTLPVGTVYYEYEPAAATTQLRIKEEVISDNDFFYTNLDPCACIDAPFVEDIDSWQQPLEYLHERDEMRSQDQQYLVLSLHDAVNLRDTINRAIEQQAAVINPQAT